MEFASVSMGGGNIMNKGAVILSDPSVILNQCKTFLFDLDGTLWLGPNILPGAQDAIGKLRDLGKEIFFFTNNSSFSDIQYLGKLTKFGLSDNPEEIIMSTHSLIGKLHEMQVDKIYLLGTPAMREMLERDRITIDEQNPQMVVVGFDKTLTWDRWAEASRLVCKGVPYILSHPDWYCPTEFGGVPDCGVIADGIKRASGGKEPVAVCGKPHPSMIEEVTRRSSSTQNEMVLFGDRLHTDIAMGHEAGIHTALVLTGETSYEQVPSAPYKPTWVVESVATLLR